VKEEKSSSDADADEGLLSTNSIEKIQEVQNVRRKHRSSAYQIVMIENFIPPWSISLKRE
jgi:hypothetical protein